MPKVTITVPDQTPQPYRFPVEREVVSMGRGEDNDITVNSGSVSVIHAEMHRVPGGYELRDLGSTNGITLDGERYEVIPLKGGGEVKLGDVLFEFALTGSEIGVLRSELMEPAAPEVSEEPISAAPVRKLPNFETTDSHEYATDTSSSGGFGKFLLLVIFLVAAFAGGLAVRYQKETGGSLVDAVKAKYAAPAEK